MIGPHLMPEPPELSPPPDITIGEARTQLQGWDIWYVSGVTTHGCTWSAKPSGTAIAVPGCAGLHELRALVKAIRRYESNLDAHIAETSKDLDQTPADMFPRREMLESRLTALLALRQMKQSV